METSRISVLFFSPTGHSRRVSRYLTEGLRPTKKPIVNTNITGKEARETPREFASDELVFVVCPVYFGRVPLPLQALPQLKGNGAATVPVVVYGNRQYEDALRELSDVLTVSGFNTVAGAAFISEHNQIPTLAAGRPDLEDRKAIAAFAEAALQKVLQAESIADILLTVPGEGDYRPYPGVPTAPVPPDGCRHCSMCADVCPVDIIDPQSFTATDPSKCIGCFACIAACPDHERHFPSPLQEMMSKKLATMAAANAERKNPTILL